VGGNCRCDGSAFGACCCAGKLRSPAPLTASPASPGPTQGARRVRQNPAKGPPKPRQTSASGGGPYLAFGIDISTGQSPAGGQSPAKTAGDWPPAGERKLALAMRQPDPAARKPPSAAID